MGAVDEWLLNVHTCQGLPARMRLPLPKFSLGLTSAIIDPSQEGKEHGDICIHVSTLVFPLDFLWETFTLLFHF